MRPDLLPHPPIAEAAPPARPAPQFTGESISEAALAQLLSTARRAATIRQAQPWNLIAGRPGSAAWQAILAASPPGPWRRAAALVLALADARETSQARPPILPVGSAVPLTATVVSSLAVPALLADWDVQAVDPVDAAALRANFCIPAEFEIVAVMAIGRAPLMHVGTPVGHASRDRRLAARPWRFAI